MRVTEQVVQIAHACVWSWTVKVTQIIVRIAHIIISMIKPIVDIEHLIMGAREYFEQNTINHGCITHHYEHSKLNYEPNTANFESHRTNSR